MGKNNFTFILYFEPTVYNIGSCELPYSLDPVDAVRQVDPENKQNRTIKKLIILLYLCITAIWVEKICGMSYWTQWYHYINDQTNIIMRNVRTNQGIDLQENIGFRNRLLRSGYSNGIQSWTRARNTFYDWTTIKDAMARNKPNTAGVPNGAARRSPNIYKTRKKLIAHY